MSTEHQDQLLNEDDYVTSLNQSLSELSKDDIDDDGDHKVYNLSTKRLKQQDNLDCSQIIKKLKTQHDYSFDESARSSVSNQLSDDSNVCFDTISHQSPINKFDIIQPVYVRNNVFLQQQQQQSNFNTNQDSIFEDVDVCFDHQSPIDMLDVNQPAYIPHDLFLQQQQQPSFNANQDSMFEDEPLDVCFDTFDDQAPIDMIDVNQPTYFRHNLFLQQQQQSNFNANQDSMFEDESVDVYFDHIDHQAPVDMFDVNQPVYVRHNVFSQQQPYYNVNRSNFILNPTNEVDLNGSYDDCSSLNGSYDYSNSILNPTNEVDLNSSYDYSNLPEYDKDDLLADFFSTGPTKNKPTKKSEQHNDCDSECNCFDKKNSTGEHQQAKSSKVPFINKATVSPSTSFEITLASIWSIQIKLDILRDLIDIDVFNGLVVGCFARVLSPISKTNFALVFIVDIIEREYYNFGKLKTNKHLKVMYPNKDQEIVKLSTVSNNPVTENEYKLWFKISKESNNLNFDKLHFNRKKDIIDEALVQQEFILKAEAEKAAKSVVHSAVKSPAKDNLVDPLVATTTQLNAEPKIETKLIETKEIETKEIETKEIETKEIETKEIETKEPEPEIEIRDTRIKTNKIVSKAIDMYERRFEKSGQLEKQMSKPNSTPSKSASDKGGLFEKYGIVSNSIISKLKRIPKIKKGSSV